VLFALCAPCFVEDPVLVCDHIIRRSPAEGAHHRFALRPVDAPQVEAGTVVVWRELPGFELRKIRHAGYRTLRAMSLPQATWVPPLKTVLVPSVIVVDDAMDIRICVTGRTALPFTLFEIGS
jgi:hypothetical protein